MEKGGDVMKMTAWLLLLSALMGASLFVTGLIGLFNGNVAWLFGVVFGVILVTATVEEAKKNNL